MDTTVLQVWSTKKIPYPCYVLEQNATGIRQIIFYTTKTACSISEVGHYSSQPRRNEQRIRSGSINSSLNSSLGSGAEYEYIARLYFTVLFLSLSLDPKVST